MMMDDFQKLVYVRLQSLPEGHLMLIGDEGAISKEEALRHVRENDEIGQVIIQIDRNYFRALKNGDFYRGIEE